MGSQAAVAHPESAATLGVPRPRATALQLPGGASAGEAAGTCTPHTRTSAVRWTACSGGTCGWRRRRRRGAVGSGGGVICAAGEAVFRHDEHSDEHARLTSRTWPEVQRAPALAALQKWTLLTSLRDARAQRGLQDSEGVIGDGPLQREMAHAAHAAGGGPAVDSVGTKMQHRAIRQTDSGRLYMCMQAVIHVHVNVHELNSWLSVAAHRRAHALGQRCIQGSPLGGIYSSSSLRRQLG